LVFLLATAPAVWAGHPLEGDYFGDNTGYSLIVDRTGVANVFVAKAGLCQYELDGTPKSCPVIGRANAPEMPVIDQPVLRRPSVSRSGRELYALGRSRFFVAVDPAEFKAGVLYLIEVGAGGAVSNVVTLRR
jgi:hypothetical protein